MEHYEEYRRVRKLVDNGKIDDAYECAKNFLTDSKQNLKQSQEEFDNAPEFLKEVLKEKIELCHTKLIGAKNTMMLPLYRQLKLSLQSQDMFVNKLFEIASLDLPPVKDDTKEFHFVYISEMIQTVISSVKNTESEEKILNSLRSLVNKINSFNPEIKKALVTKLGS